MREKTRVEKTIVEAEKAVAEARRVVAQAKNKLAKPLRKRAYLAEGKSTNTLIFTCRRSFSSKQGYLKRLIFQ